MSEQRILLLGGSGQIGSELLSSLRHLGTIHAPARAELDLTEPEALAQAVRGLSPTLIVNAAADTRVDEVEAEPGTQRAHRVNAVAPGVLARAARECGALLVHYSTDYVFDGQSRTPYAEDAPTAPLNVYGQSKLEGEREVRAATERHLILRVAWVYSATGRNFVRSIVRNVRRTGVVRVVTDQVGSPTWARAIAEATGAMLSRGFRPGEYGTYHLPSGGTATWYQFAAAILERLRDVGALTGGQNVPIRTQDLEPGVRRPAYSVLDGSKLWRTFGIRLPEWEAQLRRFFDGLDVALFDRP